MRRGLVIGKFMPLHRGHELLIDAALAECDDVTVVVYDSRPPGAYPPMPLALRLDWVAQLYPQLEQVVGLPDPLESPANEDPANAAVYAGQLEFLGRFDRFYSSEPAYERFARVLGAEHVVLDQTRELVPVSGTARSRQPVSLPRPDVAARLHVARQARGARRHGVGGEVDAGAGAR
jgi:HTH-type transcriptional regulator, transcriptional repressor of NAD biosynthesis genes